MILLEMIMGYFGPVISIMFWVITALASWRVFRKADQAGWKALIPGVREYTIFQMCWDKTNFWLYVGAVIVSAFMEVLESATGSLFYATLGSIINICVIYYEVLSKIRLSRSFGRGRAFGLFLYFLEPLALVGLGFGPYEYEGPQN